MEKEWISIIIPVYNAEKYILETIQAVRTQTCSDWELLLVEDHSTDHTREVLADAAVKMSDERIKIIENPGHGAASARNEGLKHAQGRYITFLDADDLWKKEKLERELDFMKKTGAGFVFTGYEFADEKARGTGKVVHVPGKITYFEALSNTTIFTSTVMLDSTKINRELMHMPEIKSEDTATWWQILKTGIAAYGLDENLVLYRRAGKSLSSNKLEALRRIWNLYRKAACLSVFSSSRYFLLWAVRAVKRRL
jgi:teichuronic acid biosynthesis glycosyltransferase TuaG